MIKLNMSRTAKALAALSVVTLSVGCVSLENEEGRLPDAMRSAISNLTAKGYPDLTKIPDAPTDVPTSATWTALESRLVMQGRDLSANPSAVAATPEETDLSWAATAKNSLESDPRSEPVPPIAIGGEGSPDWAAAAKAKLDADLARLPPP